MIKKIEGIIVKNSPYMESSKILTVVTKQYGVINILAKGAKKLKSNLRSTTIDLTYATFHVYYKENKLSVLICSDIIDQFNKSRNNIISITYMNFISELTIQILKQTNDESIFQDYINSLYKIEEGYDPMIITNILELKFLKFLGVEPNFDGCAVCGSKDVISLSVEKGGYICNKCHGNEYIVDTKTIKIIKMLKYLDISKISKIDVSDSTKKQINSFINDYYDKYTGLFLKSKIFLESIIN